MISLNVSLAFKSFMSDSVIFVLPYVGSVTFCVLSFSRGVHSSVITTGLGKHASSLTSRRK